MHWRLRVSYGGDSGEVVEGLVMVGGLEFRSYSMRDARTNTEDVWSVLSLGGQLPQHPALFRV